MASVFGSTVQTHSGSFRAEDLTMTFATKTGAKMLVQSAQFTVNRTVNMMYEVGSNNVYYVGDRKNGQAQLSRVVGGSAEFRSLVTDYADLCAPKSLVLTAAGGCAGVDLAGTRYDLKFATLTSIGASVQAEQIIVNENLGFICSDIEFNADGG
jgi:hypothetical protein